MTEQDYKYELQVVETEYLKAKRNLHVKYAESQRMFKIGDIIRSNTDVTIKVEKFGTCLGIGNPQPTYIGVELKKDLTPKKSGIQNTIYGNHGVELIK